MMKEINRVYVIKSKSGKAEIMNDLYDTYIKNSELSIMIGYDSSITSMLNSNLFIVKPEDVDLEHLINDFIPEIEKEAKMYCGKIFIYTNKSERECKNLITECKTHDFGEFFDKYEDRRTERTFYIFCS